MTPEQMLTSFKDNVCAKGKEIDANEEYDWYSLSIGYFLALGADIETATILAIEARYTHHYWC